MSLHSLGLQGHLLDKVQRITISAMLRLRVAGHMGIRNPGVYSGMDLSELLLKVMKVFVPRTFLKTVLYILHPIVPYLNLFCYF